MNTTTTSPQEDDWRRSAEPKRAEADAYSASSPVGDDERRRMDMQAYLAVEGALRFAVHAWSRCSWER